MLRFGYGLLFILIVSLYFSSCSKDNTSKNKTKDIEHSLIREHDSLYYVQIRLGSTSDRWRLPYPVYRFQTGDVDMNGREDMLVGVIKTTRFDSLKAKRLFIFKNYRGLVRPLWLGSRLSQPLVDFNFVQTKKGARIRSIEKEKSGKYLVAEYKWRKFGLEFTEYIKREVDSSIAELQLRK